MLSQLRTAVVPPHPPPNTTTTQPHSQPPQLPPTLASPQFARHTRPAAGAPAYHISPAQQSLQPASPNDTSATTPQSPSTITPHINGTTNGAVNSWTSVNKDSYSPLNSSAMAGGAAGWSDAEKIQLLVEILKDCEAAPNWRNIKIPPGRSSLQAQHVFASLTSSPPSSPLAQPAQPPALAPPPTPLPPPAASKKRSLPDAKVFAPPGAPGAQPPIKRKRGRPSKADIALREQQLHGGGGADVGATWQPQMYTPDTSRGGVSLATAATGTPSAAPPVVPSVTALSETPVKKKRGRPTKAEMERREQAKIALLEQQQHQQHQAQLAASSATMSAGPSSAIPSQTAPRAALPAPPSAAQVSGHNYVGADADLEDDKKDEAQSLDRGSEDAAGDSPEE